MEKEGENEITDSFLARAGCEAIMKVSTMAYLTNLEDLTFEKNKSDHKKKYETQKRLFVEERTKFISMKQEIDEPIIIYKIHVDIGSLKNMDKKNRRLKRT